MKEIIDVVLMGLKRAYEDREDILEAVEKLLDMLDLDADTRAGEQAYCSICGAKGDWMRVVFRSGGTDYRAECPVHGTDRSYDDEAILEVRRLER